MLKTLELPDLTDFHIIYIITYTINTKFAIMDTISDVLIQQKKQSWPKNHIQSCQDKEKEKHNKNPLVNELKIKH